jgi:hypothetical protein
VTGDNQREGKKKEIRRKKNEPKSPIILFYTHRFEGNSRDKPKRRGYEHEKRKETMKKEKRKKRVPSYAHVHREDLDHSFVVVVASSWQAARTTHGGKNNAFQTLDVQRILLLRRCRVWWVYVVWCACISCIIPIQRNWCKEKNNSIHIWRTHR